MISIVIQEIVLQLMCFETHSPTSLFFVHDNQLLELLSTEEENEDGNKKQFESPVIF